MKLHYVAMGVGALFLLFLLPRKRDEGEVVQPSLDYLLASGPVSKAEAVNVMEYRTPIMQFGAQYGFEAAVIAALVSVESAGKWAAVGDGGKAIGLTQIHYETARDIGFQGDKADLFNPVTNLGWGARYLRKQFDRYGGRSLGHALSGYQAGSVRMLASGQYGNQWYVDRVAKRIAFFRRLFMWYYPGYATAQNVTYELGALARMPRCCGR